MKCLLGIGKPITQTSKSEQETLLRYASAAKLIVEIGVFEGVNTLNFALNSAFDTRILAVDPFFKGTLGINYGELIAKRLWRKWNVADKIQVVKGLSWNVLDRIPDNIDFVFIDGDHSYEGVKRDFQDYSKKLSDEGVIALHDARIFEGGWTKHDWGPVVLVDQLIRSSNDWIIIEEVDSLVMVKKKCA